MQPGRRIAALELQVDAGLLAARVLDLGGRVVAETIEDGDFAASDPAAVLGRLGATSDLLATLPPELGLVGAGLALPGIVDVDVLLRAPNLGWSDLRPADLLDLCPELAPMLGNEADLAARTVAESAPGRPGRPGRHRDFLYLSGQIGVGGAAVLGGRVMTGSSGWAGEVGHVCVDPAGPACRCGSAARALAGNATALAALHTTASALGVALAGVINVLDIPTVVLGGQLAELADLLRPTLEDALGHRVLSARWRRPVIEAAEPATAAGATGAALRALDDVLSDPAAWLG